MSTMRHSHSVANLHDKQQPHHRSTSKMKISKSAPDLLKKAVTSIKSKTDALRTKLIILASLRRRMALVAAMSRKVHTTLVSSSSQEKITVVDHRDRALVLTKAMTAPSKEQPAGSDHSGKKAAGLGLFEITVFDEDDQHGHGYLHDWTRSLFDDDNYHCNDEEDVPEDGGDVDVLGVLDEPSVIEVIRSNREAEGLTFNIDDEIDEACDMFIRRCRSRMDLTL